MLDDENKTLKKVVEEKNKLLIAIKEQTAELSSYNLCIVLHMCIT